MAADGFAELDGALQGLLTQISPQQRRVLARAVAARVRQANQTRIAAQQSPDGSAFTPRLRQAKGRIRRQMFSKLRTSRWMKVSSTSNEAVVQFVGQAARLAQVHHHGLRDRIRPGGPEHQYAERPLLGFSNADISALEVMVMDHIAG